MLCLVTNFSLETYPAKVLTFFCIFFDPLSLLSFIFFTLCVLTPSASCFVPPNKAKSNKAHLSTSNAGRLSLKEPLQHPQSQHTQERCVPYVLGLFALQLCKCLCKQSAGADNVVSLLCGQNATSEPHPPSSLSENKLSALPAVWSWFLASWFAFLTCFGNRSINTQQVCLP